MISKLTPARLRRVLLTFHNICQGYPSLLPRPISDKKEAALIRGREMSAPTVFFSRCKPRGFDPIDIVLKYKIAFVGWPVWLRDACGSINVSECILDLNASHEEWVDGTRGLDRTTRSMSTLNRNLAAEIAPGSILLVPRPSQGLIYCGKVVGHFELVRNPPWIDEYLKLIGLDRDSPEAPEHIGDVVQCWRVDKFRPIPVPAVPAWIRRSLFGRSTLGRVGRAHNAAMDPFEVLNGIIDRPGRIVRPWTTDAHEVEKRLISDIGPNAFEHLSVALLQLEHPDQVWSHVGGSGDGGVDGIGANSEGEVCGILQCKWAYWGEDIGFSDRHGASGNPGRIVLTSLLHDDDLAGPSGIEFVGKREIARLVVKHAKRLSQATSLRVGSSEAV